MTLFLYFYSFVNNASNGITSIDCSESKDMRSWLVRNTTLARLATLHGLPNQLRISSTNKQAKSVMDSIEMAANVFEPVSWAVRKDHGVEVAAHWLHSLFGPLSELVYRDLGGRHQFKK